MNAFSMEAFLRLPLIGIVRGQSKNAMEGILDASRVSGLTTVEITLNTPNAPEIIRNAVARYGDTLNIGAGTVCSVTQLEISLNAGAQFIVTPILDEALIAKCREKNIPVFPGAYSPTEIYRAWEAGATMVKVFPAVQLGAGYLAQIKAPMNGLKLLPTGGINLENMPAFRNAGADGFGLASALYDKGLIEDSNWEGLKQHIARYVHLWKQCA